MINPAYNPETSPALASLKVVDQKIAVLESKIKAVNDNLKSYGALGYLNNRAEARIEKYEAKIDILNEERDTYVDAQLAEIKGETK